MVPVDAFVCIPSWSIASVCYVLKMPCLPMVSLLARPSGRNVLIHEGCALSGETSSPRPEIATRIVPHRIATFIRRQRCFALALLYPL